MRNQYILDASDIDDSPQSYLMIFILAKNGDLNRYFIQHVLEIVENIPTKVTFVQSLSSENYTSDENSFDNMEKENERITNLFYLDWLESISQWVDPVEGHLYRLLLREWAPDNGVVLVITNDVIWAVLGSVKSNSFLDSNIFSKELGQDDLLVYCSILDSLGWMLESEIVGKW